MPERWLTYRSSDGSLYVDFYFAEYEDGSGWRIYIISPINYPPDPGGRRELSLYLLEPADCHLRECAGCGRALGRCHRALCTRHRNF